MISPQRLHHGRRRGRSFRAIGFTVALAGAALAGPGDAAAHHVPGHSASEGVRNLNSLGGTTGQATSRFMVLQEFSRSETTFAPSNTYATSFVGEYAPHPWVSVGLQPTLLVVDEDRADEQVGLGDTRFSLRVTPHGDKLIHRVFTAGVNASFPTKTVRLDVDTGRTWIVTPNVMFTRTYLGPFWQAMGLASVEHRPAGTAIDLSAGGQVGYRIKGKLAPAMGALADLRVLNVCNRPGGDSEVCAGSRAGEKDRQVGSFRVQGLLSLSYAFRPWGAVSANLQYPMTPKRDFEVAGSVSVQFLFGGGMLAKRRGDEKGSRRGG